MYLHVFEGISRDFQYFQEFAGICMDLQGFPGISRYLQELAGICRDVQGFAGICKDCRSGTSVLIRDDQV